MITDYYGETHTVPGPWRTLDQVKRANVAAGHHFFDRDSMRFFRSRVAPGIIAGRLIVTSEQDDAPFLASEDRAWHGARRYTVRIVADDGTIAPAQPEGSDDGFGAFASLGTARTWARRYASGAVSSAVAEWANR